MNGPRRVIQVEVDRADAELVADALWQADPSAVGEEDLGNGRIRLTADVDAQVPLARLPGGPTVTVVELDGEAYLDRWRAWARPVRAGRRVVLQPAWLPVEGLHATDLLVRIDPGRTFGSGSHPSTRLALAAMEEHLRPGSQMLDVGTGSGVLAVTAAALGALRVVAIDIDPAAVEVTAANARANGVGDRVTVSTVPLGGVEGVYDVVAANIGAAVLRDLADDLMRRVGPAGTLVLAGLLDEQVDAVTTRFVALREVERLGEGGWVALVLA